MDFDWENWDLGFEIMDAHARGGLVYVLTTERTVETYDFHQNRIETIPLEKKSVLPTSIYADDQALLIGFKDGTIEVRLVTEGYDLLRITSTSDAAGPGKKAVQVMYATESYLLVQASENGLLIYSKPSYLFYKWIMIGGHCVISKFCIFHQLLYVLTEDSDIHMLDFSKHRIFEQRTLAYRYVDIEFDGTYLYAATSTSLLVYLQEDAERPQWQTKLAQINFDKKVEALALLDSKLLVFFPNEVIPVTLLEAEHGSLSIRTERPVNFLALHGYNGLKYGISTAYAMQTPLAVLGEKGGSRLYRINIIE